MEKAQVEPVVGLGPEELELLRLREANARLRDRLREVTAERDRWAARVTLMEHRREAAFAALLGATGGR